MNATFEGRTFQGRPRNNWAHAFRGDVKQLQGIRNWRIIGGRRQNWRRERGEARAQFLL